MTGKIILSVLAGILFLGSLGIADASNHLDFDQNETISNNIIIHDGETMRVHPGVTVTIPSDIKITVNSGGDIINNDGTIENFGVIENKGLITSSGIIDNKFHALIKNISAIINSGAIINDSRIENNGELTNTGGIDNHERIINFNLIYNTGNINNYGILDNIGTLKNDCGGIITVNDIINNPAIDVCEENGGGCLIATAAYGTELAPQVQFLREIRDNTVMSTASGTAFMTGFNQLYYSFSPTIADLERENPMFQEVVRVFITPMVSTLSVMTLADDDSEVEVLGLGISVIMLNLGMYVASPALVGFKVYKYFKSRNS